MAKGMFTEEVINSWVSGGGISSSCSPEEVRTIVLDALHNTIRFNGLCRRRWTVLEHSWLVGSMAQDFAHVAMASERIQLESRLCGLAHDFGEAIVGDIIWPLKHGKFEKSYNETYLPLEEAFREWSAVQAFGIADYPEMRKRTLEYVDHADRLCGELEMVGVSTAGDFVTGTYIDPMFESVVGTVSEDLIEREIRSLNGRIDALKEIEE